MLVGIFFTCITRNRVGVEHCSGMYVRETLVIDAIRAELSSYIKSWKVTADNRIKEQLELLQQIDCLERDLDAQSKEHQKIYEDMVLGKLTTLEYGNLKSALPDLKAELLRKKQQLEQMETETKMRQDFCDAEAGKYNLENIIECHLSTVTVYDNKRIMVEFCI